MDTPNLVATKSCKAFKINRMRESQLENKVYRRLTGIRKQHALELLKQTTVEKVPDK
jgi:hypothetical protein